MILKYFIVSLKLKNPFTTSFGTAYSRNAIIFQMEKDGIVAYSEAVTDIDPDYSYENNDSTIYMVKNYFSNFLDPFPSIEEFLERSRKIKGYNMARASIEMLLWDYYSKISNKPLYKFLGDSKGYADVGISIGMNDTKLMLEKIGQALNLGYKRIKVKIKKGKEIEILSNIRDVYPDIPLTADANSDYTIKDLDLLKKIDKFNLIYIEQPLQFDDLIDHAKLRREISTPICLDESITSPEKARKAFEIGAADVINIKPGRVGGLKNSLEIAKIARENNGHVWIGGMLETGIGRSFNISIASHSLIDYPGDTSPNSKYFERDIVKRTFEMKNGVIFPFDDPGIGTFLDHEFLISRIVSSGMILKL